MKLFGIISQNRLKIFMKILEERIKYINKIGRKFRKSPEEEERELQKLNTIARELEHQTAMINYLREIGQIKD